MSRALYPLAQEPPPGLKASPHFFGFARSVSRTPPPGTGVRRVSVGSALSRAALGAFLRAAREMKEQGTFTFADEAVSFQDISAMFEA